MKKSGGDKITILLRRSGGVLFFFSIEKELSKEVRENEKLTD